MPESDRRRPARLLGSVLLPELTHLRIRRRNRLQLPLLPLRFDQPLCIELPPLLVGEPAAPFLHRTEVRLLDLLAELDLGRELLPDVLVRLLHLIEYFLVGDLDRRVALRLLHEQLQLNQVVEDLVAHQHAARGVRRQRLPLRLGLDHLLLDLRGQNRPRADDRHDTIDRLLRARRR